MIQNSYERGVMGYCYIMSREKQEMVEKTRPPPRCLFCHFACHTPPTPGSVLRLERQAVPSAFIHRYSGETHAHEEAAR